MKGKFLFLFLSFVFFVFAHGFAIEGIDVARAVYNRYTGDDAYYLIKMFLINKSGRKRERELEIYVKDFSGLKKTFLRFLLPEDIKGTAFLSIENPDGKDATQYLFLPDLGRPRRIVSSQKKNRFVNTDYTYEDMQRRLPEKDNHTILGDVTVLGRDCYILESVPKDKKSSQYSKRISYVDKDSYLVLKQEFFGKRGKKVKEYIVYEIKDIDGILTVMRSDMIDLKRHHHTEMIVDKVAYNQGLPDDMFTLKYMERLN